MTGATSKDMIEMLRRHYLPEGKPPGGIFAPEIGAPTSDRRADLIWQGVTAASGSELIGHEIKVARSDVLAELADLTKSDAWQRFCDRWYLVIPDTSLIEGLDLPHTWGVLTPPSGRRTRSCTITKPAPKLKPYPQAPAYQTLATWLHWRHHNAVERARSAEGEARRAREAADHLRRQVPSDGRHKSRQQEIVEQIVRELGGVQYGDHIGEWGSEIQPSDVVAALKDLGSIQSLAADAQRRLDNTRDELRRMVRYIEQFLKSKERD